MESLIAPFPGLWFTQAKQRKEQTYLLLDAGFDRNITQNIYNLYNEVQCFPLFYQERHKAMLSVSPLLISIDDQNIITNWIFEKKYFLDACFFLSSPFDLEKIACSLAKNIDAVSEEGNYLLFRFYDPFTLIALLENKTKNIYRIMHGISSIAINYYDKNNQNLWGIFNKVSPDMEQPDTTSPILYDENYNTIFNSRMIRHKINQHAVACASLLHKNIITKSKSFPVTTNTLFNAKQYYSEKSLFIPDDIYDQTCSRLIKYEDLYEINNFSYLTRCDFLLHKANETQHAAIHNILMNRNMFIGDRIYLCEQMLGD